MNVRLLMSKNIVTCTLDETVATAEALMRGQQIRRLPVVDHEGRIAGILSLNDIATHAHTSKGKATHVELGPDAVAATLAAICAHSPLARAAE
jgi:CBS domain-containing protein